MIEDASVSGPKFGAQVRVRTKVEAAAETSSQRAEPPPLRWDAALLSPCPVESVQRHLVFLADRSRMVQSKEITLSSCSWDS
jgi:hypothetical protein